MDYRLELVLLPVADVDRAKAFYTETLGWSLDVDHSPSGEFRVVPGAQAGEDVGAPFVQIENARREPVRMQTGPQHVGGRREQFRCDAAHQLLSSCW